MSGARPSRFTEDTLDGISPAMKTTIDAAGRLVIPNDIRRQAGITPKMPLDVRYREGRIEIEPLPLPVRLVRKRRLLVAVPRKPVPALSATQVEATRRHLRASRSTE
jgi:AbrB family looped-hinge helix DNA binding protein